jgi:hypothetical protein
VLPGKIGVSPSRTLLSRLLNRSFPPRQAPGSSSWWEVRAFALPTSGTAPGRRRISVFQGIYALQVSIFDCARRVRNSCSPFSSSNSFFGIAGVSLPDARQGPDCSALARRSGFSSIARRKQAIAPSVSPSGFQLAAQIVLSSRRYLGCERYGGSETARARHRGDPDDAKLCRACRWAAASPGSELDRADEIALTASFRLPNCPFDYPKV